MSRLDNAIYRENKEWMMNRSKVAVLSGAALFLALTAYATEKLQSGASQKERNVQVQYADKTPPVEEIKNPEKPMNAWYEGTLNYYEFEGGFFGFTSKDGENLLPMGLDKKYHQRGAKLKLYGYIDRDVATIQMWGKPFRVLKVEVIEKGNSTHPSQL
ncbi:hypothetical protein [Thalassotalea mangrovi]|uniref:Uncharacterized protein n=1 Tax=Thalassotalea mangrovi TaxID=2572245 RepID=A0A4U1B2I9_9GAMM|nr:hypothetical protein [Thalassotalea mangrovi]TKB43918.1 hypothetical protein E8M12_13145 [Thalassotalea mangrovi]